MDDAVGNREPTLESLPELVRAAGGHKVLLITGASARYAERVQALLAPLEVVRFTGARRHVPEAVVSEALQVLEASGADAIVALGGGSAIGLGKALVLARPLPFIAVPTTYSGSEQTTLYGTTKDGKKTTGRDAKVRPSHVIYDPELTRDTPKALSVTSLLNALAHPLGAIATAPENTELRERALGAIALVYGAVEALVQDASDLRARGRAQHGAARAAAVLESATLGAHHALAHRLGGAFDLEHGALHSVLLPHSVHRLRAEVPEALAVIEAELHVVDLEGRLFDLLVRAGAQTSLKALGLSLAKLEEFLAATDERDRTLLRSAFHGRRPSAWIRLEDWGLREPVSVRGPVLGTARRVVVALHGRNATADSVIGRVFELLGSDPEVAVVAPQATDNAWYTARYTAPRAELGPALTTALAETGAALEHVLQTCGVERVALFGFSQGACLALELFARRDAPLSALVALSGGLVGPPEERTPLGAGVAGTRVLLGAAESDPYLATGSVEESARLLSAAGCRVTLEMAPGETHTFHTRQRVLARELLSGRAAPEPPAGFGNVHASEALPGTLPRTQNTPRHLPYGLHGELVSGTAFTARRAENTRTWLYRIRPSAQQSDLVPLAHPTLAGEFDAEPPLANLAGFAPLPLPSAPTDFVDGLYTLGGAGSARLRRGYAVHLYAANRNMEDRAFYDADGDLLILPELGALTLQTELGVLEVKPGELALVPRGLRFTVALAGSAARGYVAEVFGRRFALPELGPLGSNGLADARHFRAPAAWPEDRLAPGYRVSAKIGGALYQATQDYSPYDVVAWHGNHCPYVFDLALFTPAGYTRVDHPDPSIHTVVSAPMDEQGAHSLDLVIFPPRWDMTEHTFRLPYFHRNATTEINGIIAEVATQGAMFAPGCVFVTPSMTPHGVVASTVERHLAERPDRAERPHRFSDHALWFQFETALPLVLTPWARDASHRHADWRSRWGVYKPLFSPYSRDG
jgi:homogentisate 1,2-dioxygenase